MTQADDSADNPNDPDISSEEQGERWARQVREAANRQGSK